MQEIFFFAKWKVCRLQKLDYVWDERTRELLKLNFEGTLLTAQFKSVERKIFFFSFFCFCSNQISKNYLEQYKKKLLRVKLQNIQKKRQHSSKKAFKKFGFVVRIFPRQFFDFHLSMFPTGSLSKIPNFMLNLFSI